MKRVKGFAAIMASNGFLYMQVDGRGTDLKDRSYMISVHGHLGEFEVNDQIAAARYVNVITTIQVPLFFSVY